MVRCVDFMFIYSFCWFDGGRGWDQGGGGGEERRVRGLCVRTNDAVPSAASSSVDVPGGQSGATSLGQKVAVSLPIQKRWPLALTDWRWIGLAERAAMRPKGVGGVWRDWRGTGLADARRGRRDARTREECIGDGESFFFFLEGGFLTMGFFFYG